MGGRPRGAKHLINFTKLLQGLLGGHHISVKRVFFFGRPKGVTRWVDVTLVLHVKWTSHRCNTLGGRHTGVTRRVEIMQVIHVILTSHRCYTLSGHHTGVTC